MGLRAALAVPVVHGWFTVTSAFVAVGCDRSAGTPEDAPPRAEVIAPAAQGAIGAYGSSGETPFDRLRPSGPVDGGALPPLPRRGARGAEVDGGVAL